MLVIAGIGFGGWIVPQLKHDDSDQVAYLGPGITPRSCSQRRYIRRFPGRLIMAYKRSSLTQIKL